MAKRNARRGRRVSGLTIFALVLLGFLVSCSLLAAVIVRYRANPPDRDVTLRVAYSPEKEELFLELARSFNDTRPRLASGQRVELEPVEVEPEDMIEAAEENVYQVVNPDSSIWLAEIDRRWNEVSERPEVSPLTAGLVGETTRYMVSPIVIAMWRDVAASLGYPDAELGWEDLLETAAENPQFKWSHPSTTSASGLLATLATFYAGANVRRGLTAEVATAQSTIDYVSALEKTVKHYGEGELAVMRQIEQQGRGYLDAFVVQEQLVVRHNVRHGADLVAIYPFEGTLWADHPLALLEHPDRTDAERQAYALLKEFLLTRDIQQRVLSHGYRPTDLSIALDGPDSPITAANGADPTQPYTTLQIPSPSVVEVIKNVWWYTKRHTNIYLVVDTSGSMEGAKLSDAQEALLTFVDQIQGDTESVGLITFASGVYERVPLTQLGEGRDPLEREIEALEAGGNTAMLDGVDLARRRLEAIGDRERINAIVVMSDGRENASNTRLRALVEELRRSAAGQDTEDLAIVVFCIAYGRDADLDMLTTISEATGGFSRRADIETIRDLYKTLSTYF